MPFPQADNQGIVTPALGLNQLPLIQADANQTRDQLEFPDNNHTVVVENLRGSLFPVDIPQPCKQLGRVPLVAVKFNPRRQAVVHGHLFMARLRSIRRHTMNQCKNTRRKLN